jgi:hypothetical protein
MARASRISSSASNSLMVSVMAPMLAADAAPITRLRPIVEATP